MLAVSAKLGTGVTQLLDSVVERVPPPATRGPEADMRLLLFDSWYDRYHGTINLVQVRTRGHCTAGDEGAVDVLRSESIFAHFQGNLTSVQLAATT